MRKEVAYYAFDDTEFATEEACLEYEQNLRLDLSSVLLLWKKTDEMIQSAGERAISIMPSKEETE